MVVKVQGQERSKEIYQKTLDTVLSQYYNTRQPHGCFCMKLHCDIENICKFKVTNIFVSLRLFVPDLLPWYFRRNYPTSLWWKTYISYRSIQITVRIVTSNQKYSPTIPFIMLHLACYCITKTISTLHLLWIFDCTFLLKTSTFTLK